MKKIVASKAAKGVVLVLNKFLQIDANSTSCIITYQPKAPQELQRFRREK